MTLLYSVHRLTDDRHKFAAIPTTFVSCRYALSRSATHIDAEMMYQREMTGQCCHMYSVNIHARSVQPSECGRQWLSARSMLVILCSATIDLKQAPCLGRFDRAAVCKSVFSTCDAITWKIKLQGASGCTTGGMDALMNTMRM